MGQGEEGGPQRTAGPGCWPGPEQRAALGRAAAELEGFGQAVLMGSPRLVLWLFTAVGGRDIFIFLFEHIWKI